MPYTLETQEPMSVERDSLSRDSHGCFYSSNHMHNSRVTFFKKLPPAINVCLKNYCASSVLKPSRVEVIRIFSLFQPIMLEQLGHCSALPAKSEVLNELISPNIIGESNHFAQMGHLTSKTFKDSIDISSLSIE